MKANEFDAVHRTTKVFAVAPIQIQDEVPHHLQRQKKAYGAGYTCPIGLVRATVLETNAEWTSMESFGCRPGSSTHEVTHRNGVLVYIDGKEVEENQIKVGGHCTPADNGGVKLVLSKKAIVMPWSDYQPVRDARRKSQLESARRQERMAAAYNAVGAVRGSWHEYKIPDQSDYTFDERRAEVDVPLLVVEELAELLDNLGDTPGAIEQGLRHLKETIDGYADVRAAVSEDMEGKKKKRAKKK